MTRSRVVLYARLLALLTLLFGLVYPLCNWLASRRGRTWGWYADWELGIPFVPWMIWGYASIALLFALPLIALDEARMRALAKAFALATVTGGLFFVFVPTHLGFARPAAPGPLYRILYLADLPHNMVPSLHVAYSTLIVLAVGGAWASSRAAAVALGAWLVLIAASVVLVRQHHLLDVVSGLALGWACQRYYLRISSRGSPLTPRTADATAGCGS